MQSINYVKMKKWRWTKQTEGGVGEERTKKDRKFVLFIAAKTDGLMELLSLRCIYVIKQQYNQKHLGKELWRKMTILRWLLMYDTSVA